MELPYILLLLSTGHNLNEDIVIHSNCCEVLTAKSH